MTLPRRIACLILAFIICVCVSICCFSFVFFKTVSKADFWMEKCVESGVPEACCEKSVSRMKEISTPSGIPKSEFEDIVVPDNVECDMEEWLYAAENGEGYSLDTEWLKERLLNRFFKYAEDNGYELTEETKSSLEEFAGYCVDEYRNTVNIEYFALVLEYAHSYSSVIRKCFIVSAALILICVAVCIFGAGKKCFGYFAYAFLGSSGLCIFPECLLSYLKVREKFVFEPEYMMKWFFGCYNGILSNLEYISIGLFFGGVLFVVIRLFVKEK